MRQQYHKNQQLARLLAITLALVLLALPAIAANDIDLYVGDMHVLKLGKISRVAIGNGKLLSSSILENGQLLILAEDVGDTELQIWLEDGTPVTHKVFITKQDGSRTSSEVRSALRNLPSVTLRRVGEHTIVEGTVDEAGAKLIGQIAKVYKNLIDLTSQSTIDQVAAALSSIKGLKIRQVGKHILVEGAVDEEGERIVGLVKGVFPDILNLTTRSKLDNQPMVYMNVQITEFNNNALENLGINWTSTFQGPSLGFASDFVRRGDSAATITAFDNQISDNTFAATGITSAVSAIGYFGIATRITSAINMAVENNNALVLASPTLSARSGGKAEFLSGGQVPIPVPQADGVTTIEFKDFGISLKVEPEAGIGGNIIAKVDIEVSSVDEGSSVQGVPGFRTRKTSTEISLKHGETLVMSGLVTNEISKNIDQLKWLGDIPILGALFRSTDFRNSRSDLVIFITPYIVNADSPENRKAVAHAAELREKFFKAIEEDDGILE